MACGKNEDMLRHGVVTAIVEDKCVDYQVLTKHCSGCKMWEAKENQPGYDLWKASHICSINHTKSSWAKEATVAITVSNRSIGKNNLIYQEYLGDGDTSSFYEVVYANQYGKYDIIPNKLECIGHA